MRGIRERNCENPSEAFDGLTRFADLHRNAEHGRHVRTVAKECDLRLEPAGQRQVVGVENRNELAARAAHRRVHRCGHAAVGFKTLEPDALVGEAPHDLGRAIGGPVVGYEQLEVGERLVEHALHRLTDVCRMLVRLHRHRDDGGVAVRHPALRAREGAAGRAGLPTTTAPGGTSSTTTAPAPTIASAPTVTFGRSTAPAPTSAPRPIATLPAMTAPGPIEANDAIVT